MVKKEVRREGVIFNPFYNLRNFFQKKRAIFFYWFMMQPPCKNQYNIGR
jgi:hypothetical protein